MVLLLSLIYSHSLCSKIESLYYIYDNKYNTLSNSVCKSVTKYCDVDIYCNRLIQVINNVLHQE